MDDDAQGVGETDPPTKKPSKTKEVKNASNGRILSKRGAGRGNKGGRRAAAAGVHKAPNHLRLN